MVFNEELEKEIPKGWEVTDLKHIIENFDFRRKPISGSDRHSKEKIYPYYGAAALMDYIDEYIFDGEYILLGEDGSVVTENGTPVLQYVWGKFWVNNHAHVLKGKNGFDENSLYMLLKNTNITDIITGGVQAKINQTNLNSITIVKPTDQFLISYNKILRPIFWLFKSKTKENQKLTELKNLLLSKLATIK
jgi:type I restriction enzyme S subunit